MGSLAAGQRAAACCGSRARARRPRPRPARRQHRVVALDAARAFDFEGQQQDALARARRLKIGIVGFGNFGQFLAKRFVQRHEVMAVSRSDYSAEAKEMGVRYFSDMDDFCEEHPDVVILSTSILSTEGTLKKLPLERLRRSTLFVDVLSVKVFPKQLFLRELPVGFDILCLHPMFGPDSGKDSWKGLSLVYDKVRIGAEEERRRRCEQVLHMFSSEGCRMVEMSCEEHDRIAASSQFITHTVGRVLGELDLPSTSINTKGYESLLSLVENTANDSFDLYYGLFMYNQNATEELSRMERAFDDVKKQLFDQLHDVLRERFFHMPPEGAPEALALPPPDAEEAPQGQPPPSS